MLPALPTGMARTSGARPRSSQISKAAVFWPSSRNGLTELTRVTGWSSCSASARTTRSASSKLPSMATTRAPGDERLEELADRDLALGQDDDDLEAGGGAVGRGRRRGVAGRGADDRAARRPRPPWPRRRPCPRSLNEPVGFWPSTFRYRFGEAERRPEPAAVDERRAALAEAQGGRRVGDRQERAIALHRAAAGRPERPAQSSIGYRMRRVVRSRSRDATRRRRPAAARRGPHVEPSSRATAMRSPRTALEVAGPPAPGPLKATRPDRARPRSRSGSARRPSGRAAESAGTAVGRTAATQRSPSQSRGASRPAWMILPAPPRHRAWSAEADRR